MNEGMIYRKSARGAEAIATRDRDLVPRLRSLLILVDGKRTNAELAHMTPQGDIGPALEQLLQMGMIEEAAPAAPPAAPKRAGTHEAPPAGGTVPLAEAKRFAVRRLTDLLGPTAEDLCLKIEATHNAAEFISVIQRVETMLRQVRGPRVAEEFTLEIESHRPG